MSRFFAGGLVRGGGGGSFGPVYKGHESLVTPGGAAIVDQSNKLFQNLPMDTDHNKVEVHLPNKLRKLLPQSTKVRVMNDTNKEYSDSFTTHPVKGNYVEIIKTMDLQRDEAAKAVQQSATLESLAAANYRNLGETADEQKKNDVRNRLLYAGASLEQIEEVMGKIKVEQLQAIAKLPLSQEQKAVLEAEERIKRSVVHGAEPGGPEAFRVPHDTNVFNFGLPGAGAYVHHPGDRKEEAPPSVESQIVIRHGGPAAVSEVSTTRYSPALLAKRRAQVYREANPEQVANLLALPIEGRNGRGRLPDFVAAGLQTHYQIRAGGLRSLVTNMERPAQVRQMAEERPAMFGQIAEIETPSATRARLGQLPPGMMHAVPQLRNRGRGRPARESYHAEVAAPYPRGPTQAQREARAVRA